MSHRLAAACAALLMLGLVAAAPASADCPIEDPDCGGPPPTVVVQHTLDVTTAGFGETVTSTPAGIACGTDCRHVARQTLQCTSVGDCPDPDPGAWPTLTLTITGGPSHLTPLWSGCPSPSGRTCVVKLDADRTIGVAWVDMTAPSVALVAPAGGAAAGRTVAATANASDPSGIARVEFRVDGVLRSTDPVAPYQADLSLGDSAHGREHVITARAVDGAANFADAARTVVADRHVGLTVGDVPASTSATVVPVTIAADAGALVTCRLDSGQPEPCGSSYAPPLTVGAHTYTVSASDAFGNVAGAVRSFTVVAPPPPVREEPAAVTGPPPPAPRGGTAPSTTAAASVPTTAAPSVPAAAALTANRARLVRRRGRLVVDRLPARATVRFRGRTLRAKGSVLTLPKVRRGTRITVTVTAPGHVTRTLRARA